MTDTLLDDFIKRAEHFVKSVVLVGSRAEGSEGADSDIDLIITVDDIPTAKKLRAIQQSFQTSKGRPLLDCKIYTEQELSEAKSGREHFFLWTCMQVNKVILGQDVLAGIKLVPRKVIDFLWMCTTNVEEACRKLEAHIEFTGCCFSIYHAIVSLYFSEKFILHEGKSRGAKEDFIKSILETEYDIIRSRYYWVTSHLLDAPPHVLRIPAGVDKRYKQRNYGAMLSRTEAVLDILHSRIPIVVKMLESL
ncbi:MAG: nucleotidyltransferase domain-containing protein [Promethearchaeota archaeon]